MELELPLLLGALLLLAGIALRRTAATGTRAA
jgi:hypothetical protein